MPVLLGLSRRTRPTQTQTFKLASHTEGAYAVATTTTPDTLIEWNKGVDVGNNLLVGSYSEGYGAMRVYLRFQVALPKDVVFKSVRLRTYINSVDTWAAWNSSVALKDDADADFPVNLAAANSYITSGFVPVGGTSPIPTVGWKEWELDVAAFNTLFSDANWSSGNSVGLLVHQDPITVGGAFSTEVADELLRPELVMEYYDA